MSKILPDVPANDSSSTSIKPIHFAKDFIIPDTLSTTTKNASDYDYLLKFLLLGDSESGKTKLLFHLANDKQPTSFISTIGVDFKTIKLTVHSPFPDKDAQYNIKVQLWDTAGQERFRNITTSYLRGAMGIFLCFDIANRDSFQSISHIWIPQIYAHVGDVMPILVLVGLKSSQDRVVSSEEAGAFASQHRMSYVECDTQTGEYTQDVMSTMVYYTLEEVLKRV